MTDHTNGTLWIVGDDEHEGGIPFIEIASGDLPSPEFKSVCEVCCTIPDEGDFFLSDEDRANARRIVACVNACQGLETETLETSEEPLAMGALDSIRTLLDDGNIPRGTFADDQVRNLVAMFNQEKARATDAERLLAELAKDCPDCGGKGVVYLLDDETEIGQAPGSSRRDCKRCAAARAHLAGAKPVPDPLLVEARDFIREEYESLLMSVCSVVNGEPVRERIDPLSVEFVEQYESLLAKMDAALNPNVGLGDEVKQEDGK